MPTVTVLHGPRTVEMKRVGRAGGS
ncbi:MAG: hypothetical protein QOI78_837, partial [Actinomycetota bacterium]|nr:hypothetical protein [Actinomycetota bacterium]